MEQIRELFSTIEDTRHDGLALFGHKSYVSNQTKKCSVKSNVLSALIDDDVAFSVLCCL